MSLELIKNTLLTVMDSVHHIKPPSGTEAPYIVWAEDGEAGALWSDNKKRHRTDEGTIDYYTNVEYDTTVELIEQKLSDAGISNRLNSIQYEKDTGLIHYEWVWQI